MVVIKEFPSMTFTTQLDAIKHLIENKDLLIVQKKLIVKQADSLFCELPYIDKSKTDKSEGEVKELKARLVINTTNFLDSHLDVHIKGIWNKSAKERKGLLLLQEHQMTFDKIISDDVKAEVVEMPFKELGFKYDMTTEALIFNTTITPERNPFMFNQYLKGYVKEHSVGMQYVKIDMAVSPEVYESKEENAVWEKYIDQVANRKEAESIGYFWAVTEAKIIEGSSVVKGSNSITPTLELEAVKNTSNKIEPSHDTHKPHIFINI